jgi:putative ABC transport system permease protein
MIRTFLAMRGIEPGFTRPEEVQILRVSIPEAQIREPERVMRAQNDMIDKLAAIPGVTSVAFANGAPLEGFNSNDLIYAEDKQYSVGEIPPLRRFRFVSPGYFRTTGTPLLAGRDFTWTELYDKRNVAIVSQNFAREMWGDPNSALGKRLRQSQENPWREIVGVVADVHDDGVHEKAPVMVYWPVMMSRFWADPVRVTRGGAFLVRTNRAETESFLTEARQAIWSINSNLPVFRIRTLKDIYDVSMARTSFTVVMLAIAGAMALLLGLIGIYGVISYAVSQRTREVGIKMALGAQTAGLIRMFVNQGLLLAAFGVAIGIAAATVLTRLMQTLLFNTSPIDPLTFVAVALVLLLVAVLASYIPARRVTAVNPVEALHTE